VLVVERGIAVRAVLCFRPKRWMCNRQMLHIAHYTRQWMTNQDSRMPGIARTPNLRSVPAPVTVPTTGLQRRVEIDGSRLSYLDSPIEDPFKQPAVQIA
jgi:hypothetical protein